MAVTKKTTHNAEAQANMISTLRDKTSLSGMIASYIEQVQDLENVFDDLRTGRSLDSSVGSQLDLIGRIIKQPREGRDDNAYRLMLRARISLNLSSGTTEEVIALAKSIAGAVPIISTEYFPASFEFEISSAIDPGTLPVDKVAEIIKEARAVGIRGIFRFWQANPFQFDTGFGFDDGHYGQALEG